MSNFPFTVGDLLRQLERLDPDDILEFQGDLTFHRIKRRGDDLQVLEFCEAQAFLDDEFKKKNSHVQAVFIKVEPFEDGQVAQEIDINIR